MIEVAVVMLLITIVLSVVSANLGEDDSSKLRDQTNRLAIMLKAAQEEAIFSGQIVAVTFESDGYSFFVLNGDEFEPIEKEVFNPPRSARYRDHVFHLPDGMEFSKIRIENTDDEDIDKDSKEPLRLLIPPTGDVDPFVFVLKLGKHRWLLEGEFGGEIKSLESLPENDERYV